MASLGKLAPTQSRLRWWARPSALGAAVGPNFDAFASETKEVFT
jgi:hypothetical protein